jgi:hypothetical protein
MYHAFSIKQITEKLESSLPKAVTTTKQELEFEIGFMRSFDSPQAPRYRTVTQAESLHSCLIGVLFCPPDGPLAKSEIVPHMNLFHHCSGEAVDFFCVGYGAYWPPGMFKDQKEVVEIDGVKWLYSDEAYAATAREFETNTTWEDSGEACLLILVARKSSSGSVSLDFQTAVVCNLEQMTKAAAITSVRAFFNSIFRYAKSSGTSTLALSDRHGARIAKAVLKDAIVSLLPKPVADKLQAIEHFAVRDISKK